MSFWWRDLKLNLDLIDKNLSSLVVKRLELKINELLYI